MTEKLSNSEPHNHNHNPTEQEPVISQRWKWMTVLGNAAIGLTELATGNFSTMSVTSDGLHNVGDTATYYMQAETILNPNLTEQRRSRLRKIAHWAIAATSLGVSVKAGVDLSANHESAPNVATMYAAGASLALNGLMLARLRKGIRRKRQSHETVYEHDLSKHFWAVDIPSAGLAVAGAALQHYNVDIEQTAAIASGVIGAYAFRPTKANLAHNCLDHDHGSQTSHEHIHDDEHQHMPEEAPRKKSWLAQVRYKPKHGRERQRVPSRARLAVGLGGAAMALVGGLVSGDAQNKSAVQAVPAVAHGSDITHVLPETTQEPSTIMQPLPATECITLEAGDSEWKVVQRRIMEVTGEQPPDAATNAITLFTAIKNKASNPNPNMIQPDHCLQIPTIAATRTLYNAVESPKTADSQLVADLQTLNRQSNTDDAMNKETEFSRIDTYLRSAGVPQFEQ